MVKESCTGLVIEGSFCTRTVDTYTFLTKSSVMNRLITSLSSSQFVSEAKNLLTLLTEKPSVIGNINGSIVKVTRITGFERSPNTLFFELP